MPAKKISQQALQFNKAVGQRIRLYRKLRKLSLVKLGEKLNITAGQASTYERGCGDMSIYRLKEISDALEIPIYELFPDMGYDYKPFSDSAIKLLGYMFNKNLDAKEVLDLVKEYQRDGLFKIGDKTDD